MFDLVRMEAARAVSIHGVQDRHPFEWLAFLSEEFGELSKAMNEAVYRNGSTCEVAIEAVQVATLALKIAEMYRAETTARAKVGG
ncbi:MAG: hypothetical protein M0Q43_09395 [Methanothrix sp.]|nr:hypothetical protein [Methanothrix sp.]